MPAQRAPKSEPLTLERIERVLLAAENGDPDALREVLSTAPQWHTPPGNLVGGDHLGQEQAIRFLRDCRDLTHGTLHVEEVGRPEVRGDVTTLTLRTTGFRGSSRLDTVQRVKVRLEGGRVAELWTEPADRATWDRFWAPGG